jgi:SAM-dependent methyltransferase
MAEPAHDMLIFARALLRRRRARAATGWSRHNFLKARVAEALAERLDDIRRPFPRLLDLGGHGGEVAAALAGRAGGELAVTTDLAPTFLPPSGLRVAVDEEALPFAPHSFDLVTSALALHNVNDLPGTLLQIRQALRPDGLFLGAMFGAETLTELRQALLQAESEIEGGASPRISPFADLRDAAGLLQRAGFNMPVADIERLTVSYADAFALMRELRGMGETNILHSRRRQPLRRATLLRAAEIYQQRFAGPDGRIRASFSILHLHGWVAHESQQQPLKPGSAKQSLAQALGGSEQPTGEKAKPR